MNKRHALATVFLVVLVDLIGFGIVLPHLALYASEFHVSAFSIGFLYSAYSLAQLLSSPFWGSLSDRIGRRPVMMLSTFGAFLAYLGFAFSTSFAALFLSRLFAGAMAGNISAAQAYVADVTTSEERTRGMGLIGAAFGIGFVLGPAIGAGLMYLNWSQVFFQENHYAVLGFFAAALSFSSFLLVVFRLPESANAAQPNDATRILRAGIFSAVFWRPLLQKSGQATQKRMSILMFSVFLLAFGQASLYGAFPLYCRTQLGFSASEIGMQYVWMGLSAVLVQGLLIRRLEKRFGEKRLFLIGSILMTLGLGSIAFAKNPAILTPVLVVMATGGSLNVPVLNSMISKQSGSREYGAAMGASQGFAALGRALGPAWGGLLFGWHFRSPFVVTAAVVAVTVYFGLGTQDR